MSEIAPASREDVERLKTHAQSLIANLNTTEENFDISQTVLSLIAWGEAAEDEYNACFMAMVEEQKRAEAAESRAAQAEKVVQDGLVAMDPIVHALGIEDSDTTPLEAIERLYATVEAERARAAQDRAAMRGMAGALQEIVALTARTPGGLDAAINAVSIVARTTSATPSAAVALAEREVVEAARVLETAWTAGLPSAGDSEGVLALAVGNLNAARLRALEAEIAWRPIETAQNDGTPVLVCGGTIHAHDESTVPYIGTFEGVSIAYWYRGQWRGDTLEGHDNYYEHKPTHWRHLPKPVATLKDTANG